MATISERLREQREKAKLSQGQVAQYEGVSQGYISKLEIELNAPNVWPLLGQLARRYKTSTDYLLGLTDDPRPVAVEAGVMREAYVTYEVSRPELRGEVQRVVDLFVGLGEEDRAFVLEMLDLVGKRKSARIIGE